MNRSAPSPESPSSGPARRGRAGREPAGAAPSRFEPIHDRHAIARVVFGLHLDSDLSRDEYDRVVKAHDRWQEILPRIEEGPVVSVAFGSPRQVPATPPLPPLSFQRMAPAGQIEGELRVHQDLIAIHWTAYTTWDAMWNTARYLFGSVVGCMQEGRGLRAVELQYLDVFVMTEKPSSEDFRSLLDIDSRNLPTGIMDRGPFWHLHQGWFLTPSDLPAGAERLLQRMHLDSVQESSSRYLVRLDNHHRLDLEPAQRLATFFGNDDGGATAVFRSLHDSAKRLLARFLTPAAAGRISLDRA